MKLAVSTVLMVAVTLTQALAVADAEPKRRRGNSFVGWCGAIGAPCAKVKRDAEAMPDPKKRRGNSFTGWCGAIGAPCARVKRSADAIAEAFAYPEADPKKRRGNSFVGWCGAIGAPCAKAKRDIIEVGESVEEAVHDVYAREAEAEADPKKRRGNSFVGWCGAIGAPCAKRDLFSEVETDVSAEDSEDEDAIYARDAAPEARRKKKAKKPKRRGHRGNSFVGWCGALGAPCAKVKRDADAVAFAEAKKQRGNSFTGWCGAIGAPCAKDKREEHEILKTDVCEADDGECKALRNAYEAFHEIKARDAELEAENLASIDDDDELTKREVEVCNEPDGECDLAKRALDTIEAKLDAAIKAL
ncbi:uncharacterized protein MYCGRDRAFT_110066 [Zymoseptoria tritici IPO323]|uniref:Uncharacterized protein n=1 Tax=Zymoseptoria tritici (strain CBS 115943 / IPO323) TaxID=336722 RepID=F9XEM4_ZYMTI|nr:uncharacterized protein MYCGRDRAFT_110066 [Zymoseptoria tritici IPO323]EGP86263.1 hypothetical protein MYCGRDRAFT_110066 [Zymoseptoria tritici IPO323]